MAVARMKHAPKEQTPKEDIVEVFDCDQNSEAWHELRRGVPTASRFKTIMASGKDGGESQTRRKLMLQMAGEILSGETAVTFRNEHMDRGIAMEAEARDYYARTNFADLHPVGFVRRTIHLPLGGTLVVGCSPDSMIAGGARVLEVKTMAPDLLIEASLKGAGGFPSEHRAQCQGTMWVTGASSVDLMLFYRGMPVAPTFTIARDEAYIAQIRNHVEVFDYELKRIISDYRKLGKSS